ncbi:MAG: hypothetical protein JWN13_2952 [Betaproteobacteria bacterium]|jgi:hypothetical protein|nr:hypothetical protein [Betaproteobacteria bacterium]
MMRSLLLMLFAMALASAATATEPLGRFFFTPAERARLDQARIQKQRAPQAVIADAIAPPPLPEVITYSGIVRRSDGRSILWLNNRPAEEKEALSGLPVNGRVGADGAVTLYVPQTGSTIQLKVGQRAELQTGTVAEARPAAAASTTPAPKQPDEHAVETKAEPSLPPLNKPMASRPDRREEPRVSGSERK